MRREGKMDVGWSAWWARSTWVLGAGLLAVGAPQDAEACHTETFCVDIETDFEDSTYGDYAPLVGEEVILPARGVRMVIIPPPPEVAREVFANDEGCFTLQTEFTTGFRLVVYPEALLGQDQNIHVCTYDDAAQFNADYEPNGVCGGEMMEPFAFPVNGMGLDDEAHCTIPPSDGWSTFGMAIQIVDRIDTHTVPNLAGIHEMRLGTFNPENNPDATLQQQLHGAYGTRPNVYFSNLAVQKKFVIAHEIGHWFQNSWAPTIWPASVALHDEGNPYIYEAVEVSCMFDAEGLSDSHGIRSAEHGFGAFFEGTAHFLATYAFDDDGIPGASFRYYKTVEDEPEGNPIWLAYADLRAVDYEITMLGELGGTLAWTENVCPGDWNATDPGSMPPLAVDISSEIDWMRFWWQFMHYDAPGVPTVLNHPNLSHLRAVLEAVAQSPALVTDGARYPLLSEMMATDPNGFGLDTYAERFDYLAASNGVYNVATSP